MSARRDVLARRVAHEVRETVRNPGRVRQLADRQAVRDLMAGLRAPAAPEVRGGPWGPKGSERLIGRSYASYEDYRRHQAAKLETLDLTGYDARYRELLGARLRAAGQVQPRARVLCLAARIGTEVKAFHDLGCFAVGIDLNPGEGNRYVVHGDFHELQFPDGCADVVFTNSLDHVLELDRVVGEVRRVLAPGGVFVVEASLGREEGHAPRDFESFYWDTLDDLLAAIERHGFERLGASRFDEPWPGMHVTLRVADG